MADKNDSRRKLLKSIAAGSGAVAAGKAMPESWSKPVIDSVMLPAHAETTDDIGTAPGTTVAPGTTAEAGSCPDCQNYYCYSFYESDEVPLYMEILLNGAQVAIKIITTFGPLNGTGVCTDGTFEISLAGAYFTVVVLGTIATDCSQVTGTLTGGGEPPLAYIAKTNLCGGRG